MLNGFISAVSVFFLCTAALEPQAFNKDGQVADRGILGPVMYTCIVWIVSLQMALSVSYFTMIHHLFIWGSIILWYLFLLTYGAISPIISANAYKVFVEALAPTPSFWVITLFVVVSTLIPYFAYSSFKMWLFPTYHEIIQWIRHKETPQDPESHSMIAQGTCLSSRSLHTEEKRGTSG